jgi:hypothetical protein
MENCDESPLTGKQSKRTSRAKGICKTDFRVHEVEQHIGENATVCGVVASGRYAERTRGRPKFL